MQLTYPRLVGVLGLIWAAILQRGALEWPSESLWLVYTIAWIGACTLLVLGRHVRWAAASVALLIGLLMVGPGRHLHIGATLLWWIALTVALTEGRPLERALAIRATVTIAYASAALAKLNPSFLSGEQLLGMTLDRSQLAGLEDLMRTALGPALSWAAVATEAWLAVGLWFARTRTFTAVLGFVLHATFVIIANNGTVWDIAFVTVLNFGLVASYLAFYSPITDDHISRQPGDQPVRTND